jgi:hypothetical protein
VLVDERDKNVVAMTDLFGSSFEKAFPDEGTPQALLPLVVLVDPQVAPLTPLVLLDPQVEPDSNAKM